MPVKSRFTRLDAFTKTVEDARIRTNSGGIVTILSLFVIFYLIWGEWTDYRQITVLPELVVDKGRGEVACEQLCDHSVSSANLCSAERMEIHLNVTFPRVPCGLLTLDVVDISEERQEGLEHGVSKVRLKPESQGGAPIDRTSLDVHGQDSLVQPVGPDYCGSCYSAPAPSNAQKPGCCNTCEEVREAYAANNWSFGRGDGVEQCEREGYGAMLDSERKEGCRIEGGLRVNKVSGNFHFAPGRSFSSGSMHTHDINSYINTPTEDAHTFAHHIHQIHFGPKLPDDIFEQWADYQQGNPLDSTSQATDDTLASFIYFIKVVSTSFIPLGVDGQAATSSSSPHLSESQDQNEKKEKQKRQNKQTPLQGDPKSDPKFQSPLENQAIFHPDAPIETHQYSVTSHRRSLRGGTDAAEGHQERIHSAGGIPGVFFHYDISPMKVIHREVKAKTLTGFLAGVCAIIGGTLTVAAAVDRALYEGSAKLKKLHSQ